MASAKRPSASGNAAILSRMPRTGPAPCTPRFSLPERHRLPSLLVPAPARGRAPSGDARMSQSRCALFWAGPLPAAIAPRSGHGPAPARGEDSRSNLSKPMNPASFAWMSSPGSPSRATPAWVCRLRAQPRRPESAEVFLKLAIHTAPVLARRA